MKITTPQFSKFNNEPVGFNIWEVDKETKISLLSLQELQNLKKEKPNTQLISIFGEKTKASSCDEDIRYGYTAYGRKIK